MFRRDSVRAIHGLPDEVFMWRTTLGQGRTQPDSWIVIANDGHSFAFVAHVCHVVRLFSLER
jgi:hypothetical protein